MLMKPRVISIASMGIILSTFAWALFSNLLGFSSDIMALTTATIGVGLMGFASYRLPIKPKVEYVIILILIFTLSYFLLFPILGTNFAKFI